MMTHCVFMCHNALLRIVRACSFPCVWFPCVCPMRVVGTCGMLQALPHAMRERKPMVNPMVNPMV